MEEFYVYAYLDPRKPTDLKSGEFTFSHEPFYIGKGKGWRINYHWYEAETSKASNYKLNKIRKIYELGLEPIMIKLKENISEAEAKTLEMFLIADIGTFKRIEGIKTGPLANLTSGGEGGLIGATTGYADEVLEKLSAARVNRQWMTDGVDQRYVSILEIPAWEEKGWKRGTKPSIKRDEFMANGGSSKGLVWVNDGKQNKRVCDSAELVAKGWIEGQLSKTAGKHRIGTRWINNGVISKSVSIDDLEKYTATGEWSIGRIKQTEASQEKRRQTWAAKRMMK